MRLSWQQINDYNDPFGGGVFLSGGSEAAPMATPWLNWESLLPDLTTLGESAIANPNIGAMFGPSGMIAFDDAFRKGVNKALNPLMEHIGQLVMHDFVQGARQTLGQMVQTVGILSNAFSNIYTIFSTPIRSVEDAFKVVDMALENTMKALEMALNGISAIPIVGWIIRIVYEVAKSVANIVIASRDERADVARRSMAKQLTIPFSSTEFDPQTDDMVAKAFFDKIGNVREPKSIISPSFRVRNDSSCASGFKSSSGFCADGVRRKDGDNVAAGWVVNPATVTGGLGFVPGTSSITAGFYFPAKNGGFFKDMGSLYPTASNLCTGWWGNITRPGPSMFSLAPLASKDEWENYMESLFAFGQRELPKGWASNGAAIKFTNKFDCRSEMYGVGSCKRSSNGKKLKIPSDMGRDAHLVFYAHLLRLFFGIERPYSASLGKLNQVPHIGNLDDPKRSYKDAHGTRFWNTKGINFSKSVPTRSLDDLYSRQLATLQSMQCMYVNGEDRRTFPAFTNSNLRRKWSEGVTDIFASGAWRRVIFRDMPEGSAKNAFAQYASQHGIKDVESYNRPCAPGEALGNCGPTDIRTTLSAAPGIPEAPGLPTPPMNDVVVKAALAKDFNEDRKKKGKGSNLPLVLAVGAVGLLIASNRK